MGLTLCADVRHHARMPEGSEGKDVLSSLPRSRPTRRSAKRDGGKTKATKAKPTQRATPDARRPTPKAQAAKPKPQAPPKPKQKVSGATRPSAATRRAREESVKPPPRPAPPERDVVGTALEAAGELARIGLTVGTQIVREATRRIPRP
jgi:hypothetical protein